MTIGMILFAAVVILVVVLFIFGGIPKLPMFRLGRFSAAGDPCEECGDHKEGIYAILDRYPIETRRNILAYLDTMTQDPQAPSFPSCPIPVQKRICRHSLERVKEVAAMVAQETK